MTAYRLKLQPGGIIPPALHIGVEMQRAPEPAEPPAAIEAPAPPPAPPVLVKRLPAGADNWLDAAEIDISEGTFLDRLSEVTYVKDFTREPGEPNVFPPPGDSDYPELQRTAWWKFFVPVEKLVWIDVDTKLCFGSPASVSTAPANTTLNVYVKNEEEDEFSSLFAQGGSRDVGSGGINNGGVGDLDYWNFGQYAEAHNVACYGNQGSNPEGTWFYIQVGDEYEDDNPHAFVLRMSMTDKATDDGNYPKWILDARDPAE